MFDIFIKIKMRIVGIMFGVFIILKNKTACTALRQYRRFFMKNK